MTWKDRINHVLGEHSDSQLCLECIIELAPEMSQREAFDTLEQMKGRPYWVSRWEGACGRCGKQATVYACD